jgi:glutamate-1-semialdehyde 2,1-aminomutase
MTNKDSHPVVQEITERYMRRTPRSRQHIEAAKQWLPGGETRRTTYFTPYPTIMVKGEGCHLYDCDGNRYIDFLNNYTSLIHGHAHPSVVEATSAQLKNGVVLGAATELQYRHAAYLCDRVPSLEMVRYCNCGTEATMFAMRTARAFTGRHTILKMDGGFHGGHEFAQVNIFPDLESEGFPRVYADPWIPAGVLNEVLVVPFNDLEGTENVIKEHKDRIAAVILEPCMSAGGSIGPKPGYLKGMRALTERYGLLLIFDEVMSFRHFYGGMQAVDEVVPDLTALGKIIGGGFPVGAFGGRKEIMELYNPAHPQSIFHSGTFSGNSVTMAAGLSTLQLYDQQAVDQLNGLGDRLRQGYRSAFQEVGIRGQITGLGSTFNIHWMKDEPFNAKVAMKALMAAGELPGLFHLEMMNRGIYIAPRGLMALSTPMTEREIDVMIEALNETITLLKPYVADVLPHLL